MAHGVLNNRQFGVLQVLSHAGFAVRDPAPSGGNSGLAHVGGVVRGDGRQGYLVDGSREGYGWGLDQGDIVAHGQGDIVGVLDPVGAGNGVGELRLGTDGSSVVDGHGGGTEKHKNQ